MSEREKPRISPLNTVIGVSREMGKVYREARRGELDVGDAMKLTMILREIRCALEADDFERRLAAVEATK